LEVLDGASEVRRTIGVKPVDDAASPAELIGPGSEKRTRFLVFFGVTMLRRVRRRAMGRSSCSIVAIFRQAGQAGPQCCLFKLGVVRVEE
jgi:hypothetical protein